MAWDKMRAVLDMNSERHLVWVLPHQKKAPFSSPQLHLPDLISRVYMIAHESPTQRV